MDEARFDSQSSSEMERMKDQVQEARKQLEECEKMATLGQLTAGIVHEIKNPLNFIKNFSELTLELVQELNEEIVKLTSSIDPGEIGYLNGTLADINGNLLKIMNTVSVPIASSGECCSSTWKDFNYHSKRLKLLPGDRLFLYTDGVTEAFNIQDQVYGDERLKSYLKSRLSLTIDDVIRESMNEINAFSSGMSQSDDITCLVISYNGHP